MQATSGVFLHMHNTTKFKDIGMSLRFMAPLSKEEASIRSLLVMMMMDRCEAYPSKKAMSDQQDFLYGATLNAQSVGYGRAQVLDIRMKLIDPRYVLEEGLLTHALAYLRQVLFHPLLNEEMLAEAKLILKAKLKRLRDDPAQYVVSRGLQIAGANTPMSISALGEWDQIDDITLADIHQAHHQLLYENRIDIMVCGAIDENDFMSMINKYLPFEPRKTDYQTHYTVQCHVDQPLVKEYRKLQQCSIFMLWQTNMDICDPHYYALRLGAAMFGQYPTSLLFQEVREKRSLCYSIYAGLLAYDGALGVTTGVEQEHIDAAIELIYEQFQRIANGGFDESLLEVSKTMIIHSLKASKDAMNSIIAQQYQNCVLNQQLSVEDRIDLIKQVDKEMVMNAFQGCKSIMSFVVCNEGEAS